MKPDNTAVDNKVCMTVMSDFLMTTWSFGDLQWIKMKWVNNSEQQWVSFTNKLQCSIWTKTNNRSVFSLNLSGPYSVAASCFLQNLTKTQAKVTLYTWTVMNTATLTSLCDSCRPIAYKLWGLTCLTDPSSVERSWQSSLDILGMNLRVFAGMYRCLLLNPTVLDIKCST